MSARSWYSGLSCSSCGAKVLVNAEHGALFRATFTERGKVATSEAVCGDCRCSELEEKAAA